MIFNHISPFNYLRKSKKKDSITMKDRFYIFVNSAFLTAILAIFSSILLPENTQKVFKTISFEEKGQGGTTASKLINFDWIR